LTSHFSLIPNVGLLLSEIRAKKRKRLAFEAVSHKNKKSKTMYSRQFELESRPAIYLSAAFFARASNP
jgi:hypothetical protein